MNQAHPRQRSQPAARVPDLSGRVAIVTGGNSGLGYEVTRVLASRGAHVILACRDTERAASAIRLIRRDVPEAKLDVGQLDLAELSSIRTFAQQVGADLDRLDLLINNAGVMGVDLGVTKDGTETHLGVNHIGHFALTAHLMPLVLQTPGSRICTMTSINHRFAHNPVDLSGQQPYRRMRAYAQSKLANLLFSAELHRRLRAAGADTLAVAAHPGVTNTELGTHGSGAINTVLAAAAPRLGQNTAVGARPMLYAALAPQARGGQLYGPRYLIRGAPPVAETPSRAARDADAAAALWARSSEVAGIEPVTNHGHATK